MSQSTPKTYLRNARPAVSFRRAFRSLSGLLPLLVLSLCAMVSCITEDVPPDTRRGNFEALWKIMDEHYCFFDYKAEECGVDWDEVKARYAPAISEGMSNEQLFEVLGNMLRELRDGHVNLYASHDVARYADWYDNYPTNYSDSLLRIYLGRATDYRQASTLRYRVIDGNIGYLRVPTFEYSIGTGNIGETMRYLALCDGLIVDVRNNGGGILTEAQELAGIFVNEKTCGGYITHKTGHGHNDFSSPKAITIDPFAGLRWQKKVVILTNRHTYSAANCFVMICKGLPNVTIMGDRTGGGAGLPFTSELPNGWSMRLSACPMYDRNMVLTEQGIDPDIHVDITPEDYRNGIDTMIERARQFLTSKE